MEWFQSENLELISLIGGIIVGLTLKKLDIISGDMIIVFVIIIFFTIVFRFVMSRKNNILLLLMIALLGIFNSCCLKDKKEKQTEQCCTCCIDKKYYVTKQEGYSGIYCTEIPESQFYSLVPSKLKVMQIEILNNVILLNYVIADDEYSHLTKMIKTCCDISAYFNVVEPGLWEQVSNLEHLKCLLDAIDPNDIHLKQLGHTGIESTILIGIQGKTNFCEQADDANTLIKHNKNNKNVT